MPRVWPIWVATGQHSTTTGAMIFTDGTTNVPIGEEERHMLRQVMGYEFLQVREAARRLNGVD